MKGNLFLAVQQHCLAWTCAVTEWDEISNQRKKLRTEMKKEKNSCKVGVERMREGDKTRKG